MRTGLRVNFVKVHKVNNIIIDCAARNAEPFRKIIDILIYHCCHAIIFMYPYNGLVVAVHKNMLD